VSVFMQPVAVSAASQAVVTALWAATILGAGLVWAWQSRRNLSIKRLQRVQIVDALLIAVGVAVIGHSYVYLACDAMPLCCDDWWGWLCYLVV